MHWLPVNLDAVRQEGTVFSITACAVNSPRALRATTTISRRANGHGCGVYLCVSRIASLNVMARVSVLSSVARVSVLDVIDAYKIIYSSVRNERSSLDFFI